MFARTKRNLSIVNGGIYIYTVCTSGMALLYSIQEKVTISPVICYPIIAVAAVVGGIYGYYSYYQNLINDESVQRAKVTQEDKVKGEEQEHKEKMVNGLKVMNDQQLLDYLAKNKDTPSLKLELSKLGYVIKRSPDQKNRPSITMSEAKIQVSSYRDDSPTTPYSQVHSNVLLRSSDSPSGDNKLPEPPAPFTTRERSAPAPSTSSNSPLPPPWHGYNPASGGTAVIRKSLASLPPPHAYSHLPSHKEVTEQASPLVNSRTLAVASDVGSSRNLTVVSVVEMQATWRPSNVPAFFDSNSEEEFVPPPPSLTPTLPPQAPLIKGGSAPGPFQYSSHSNRNTSANSNDSSGNQRRSSGSPRHS
jgi:hypothetical protein